MTDRPEARCASPDLLDRAYRDPGKVLIRSLYGHQLLGQVDLRTAADGQAVSPRLALRPEQAAMLARVLERCRKGLRVV